MGCRTRWLESERTWFPFVLVPFRTMYFLGSLSCISEYLPIDIVGGASEEVKKSMVGLVIKNADLFLFQTCQFNIYMIILLKI